jgi:hypothetical protein
LLDERFVRQTSQFGGLAQTQCAILEELDGERDADAGAQQFLVERDGNEQWVAVFRHDRELALLCVSYQFAGAFPEITNSEGFHVLSVAVGYGLLAQFFEQKVGQF